MAVDTSIYNALGRGVKTVRDWQQEDEQRQQTAQANELNALNLGNARATAADNALVRQDQSVIRNALQNVRPGATQEDIAGAYEGTRTPTGLTQAQAIRKAIAEAERLKAQTAASTAAAGASEASQKATEYKLQIDKHNTALNDILSFQTPAEAMESLRRHAAGGQIPPEAVQAMSRELMGMSTPEQFAQWQESKAAGLMDAKSRAELALRRQEAQDRRTNQAGEAANRDLVLDPVSGRYVLNQPLQSAKVARAQAGQSVTMGSPVAVTLPSGEQGYVQPANKPGAAPTIMTIPGAGGGRISPPPKEDKPLNDSQSKALLFGTRMQEANKVIDQLAGEGTQTSVPGSRAPIVGGVISMAQGPKQQSLDQAKRDFMTAVLRRESGASISPGEFETADKVYFPQIGEPPSVLAQKARARQLAISGVLVEVPENKRASITPGPPRNAAKPSGTSTDLGGGFSLKH